MITRARALCLMSLTGGMIGLPTACAVDTHATDEAVDLARGDRAKGIQNVKHVIVVMLENHSFDNYFGALAYAPGSPYHQATDSAGCPADDNRCIDGLTCEVDAVGELRCSNANVDAAGNTVVAFHNPNRCVVPDPDHEWVGTHRQVNFAQPNDTLSSTPMDGFVLTNDEIVADEAGTPPDETMAFYHQAEIPFYYDLAQRFAISDRFFSSLLGPTFPNRAYLLAGTSFGHLTSSDQFPPPEGYKPINGTIFDLLDRNGVSWANYFTDVPGGASFRPFGVVTDPSFLPLPVFLAQAAGLPGAGALPSVSFVDPGFGLLGTASQTDEHPPTDIQRGQAFVSTVINTVRNGPFWKDSVIFIVYDEHGGFYDHAVPPPAVEPDGIRPGQCADLSNPPASLLPGGGANCSSNLAGDPATSVAIAIELCPALAADPTGPFPAGCAKFDQLGLRVPFMAISPFAKPSYVSHTVADLTSILAFIETAFLGKKRGGRQHLTERDRNADNLLDLFDFKRSPSLNTPVGQAAPPANDCTPLAL
jgi:phospholipase C